MELYVFSDRRVASIAEWQEAIDAEGFKLWLSSDRPMDALQGMLPVRLGDRRTVFECDHWDVGALISESPDINFDHSWKNALAFRWGADLYAGPAAYMAGAAYAKVAGGIVFDCEEHRIISPQRAAEIARDLERSLPEIEAVVARVVARLKSRPG